MLNKQHQNETTYDLLMVRDAVCVDDEPHRLTLAALGNRDIGKININNDKPSMSNGKLVKVVFEPLILIEDKVEVSSPTSEAASSSSRFRSEPTCSATASWTSQLRLAPHFLLRTSLSASPASTC